MWQTLSTILKLEICLFAYFIYTIWIHINRVIHRLYHYYVKPRIISNYLNLWFGHDEMDARYGHSNFWCLYIYLNQNSLTAKFITCLTFLSPVVCIVVNFQSKKKSFGAICISWTWCYEDNKYKNFLKTMHIYKQNWIASSVIKYDCSSMIYIAENIFEVRKLLKLIFFRILYNLSFQ